MLPGCSRTRPPAGTLVNPAAPPRAVPILYSPPPAPCLQEGCCAFGDHCPYAHNVFEYWLHPTRYRTQLCNDGSNCKRKICFFAHRWARGLTAGGTADLPRLPLLI